MCAFLACMQSFTMEEKKNPSLSSKKPKISTSSQKENTAKKQISKT